jgi:hypothetical protein
LNEIIETSQTAGADSGAGVIWVVFSMTNKEISRRIFVDTYVVNFILGWRKRPARGSLFNYGLAAFR